MQHKVVTRKQGCYSQADCPHCCTNQSYAATTATCDRLPLPPHKQALGQTDTTSGSTFTPNTSSSSSSSSGGQPFGNAAEAAAAVAAAAASAGSDPSQFKLVCSDISSEIGEAWKCGGVGACRCGNRRQGM